jgi:hypothetical protein
MFKSSTTETKIAVLEERLSVYEQMMNRIDSAIEKISQTNQSINKMLAIHNEKIEQCNRADTVMLSMMETMKNESKQHYDKIKKDFNTRLDELEKKVEHTSQIKWMVMGMGVLAAICVTAVAQIASGMLTPKQMPPIIERAK